MTDSFLPKDIVNDLGKLVQAEERLGFKKGQMIFYEGHKPCGIFVLKTGFVRLFRMESGAEKVLAIREPGQVLEEKAFLQDKSFGCSARAETDVSVGFFSRKFLERCRGTDRGKG